MTQSSPTVRRTWRQRLIWPGGLIFMVMALVTVDVTMFMVASGDPSFAVAEVDGDPSEAWNRQRAQERRNDELGWDAALRIDLPIGEPAVAVVELRDAGGEPVTDATISLVAFHAARAANRLRAVLVADPDAPGVYRARLPVAREGHWSFSLACTRGEDVFTADSRQLLLLPAAAITTPAAADAGEVTG
jgi:nitrogen fixation protein FixH